MADNKITIDIEVNGKMQKATLSTKKLRKQLDELEGTQDKVSKGASNLSRNMQGASKRTSNTTKEFSKLQQGMGGVVGIYATIAAQVFAVSAAFQFLKSASDVSNLIAGQEALGAVSGVAYKTLTAGIREATAGQLSFAEASRAAAIGTASGLSPDQLNGLANAAKNASVALGRDLTDSFNRLIRGTTKAEPELLDELGIVLRLDTALGKYAQALGKNANELSAFERSQAVANEVLEQANNKFGALEKNLDPGIFALNQFLNSFDELINAFKSGVIDTLRPVFVFLSQNTGALAASLALFALPIVKAIVPNLEDWRESAEKTLQAQEGRYDKLSKEADKYSLNLKTLGKEEKQLRAEADRIAQKAGGPTDKSREGGLAFLQGKDSAQTKAGMANADKILKTAEAQIASSAKRRTGALRHMNAEQVADMRRSYDLRAAILKKHDIQDATFLKRAELRAKATYFRIGASYQKMATLISRASVQMSRAMNAAFAATGIIGLIFLVKDLGTMILDAFVPGRKELKKLQEEVDDTADKYETLAGELKAISNVMKDADVSLVQRIEQLGNAVNSANLDQLIKDFDKLEEQKAAGANVAALETNLKKTLAGVTEISPELGRLAAIVLEGGDAADQAKKDMKNYANILIEGAAASKQMADATRATNAELTKLITSAKPTTILDGLAAAARSEQSLSAARRKSSEIVARDAQARLDALDLEKKKIEDMPDTRTTVNRRGRTITVDTNKKALLEEIEQQRANQAEQVKNDKEQLSEITKRDDALKNFNKSLETSIEKNRKYFDDAIAGEKEANSIRTLGLSAAGKAANLRSADLKAQSKILRIEGSRLVAADLLAEANASDNEEEREMIPALQQALALEEQRLDIAQKDLALLRQRNTLQNTLNAIEDKKKDLTLGQTQISQAKELLSIEQKRVSAIGQIAQVGMKDAQRQIKLEAERRSVGNPFFDQEQFIRKETLELEKSTLEQRINQARIESQIRRDQINLDFKLQEVKRKQTILELEKFKQEEVARLREADRGGELVSTVTSINSLISDLESLDFKGPRDAALALETTLLNAKEAELEGVVSSLEVGEEKASAINQVLDSAGDAFKDGLGDAIGATFDVITGKTSSLKDALAGIAQDVLQTIQDKFVEEMFVRPILESKFFGDQKKDFTPEQIAQTAQQGIQQGIVDGGKALATEVKTAAEGVAEVIKEGGRLAGEQIQSSGCLNLCKDEQTVSQRAGMDTAEVTATIPEERVKSADVLQEVTVPEREKKTDAEGNIIGEDGNAGKSPLDGLKSVLGENIAATGLLVGTVLGNTTIGEKIQKVSAALLAIDMIMKILAKLGLISEKANTTALIANTAATLKAAATNLFFKDGGLVSDKVSAYNTGGIAKGPSSGYPAVLHGNEAVVPLPDGRTIPVTMQGGGGSQQNNVTVNVNVDNEGGASSSVSQTDGKMASELGNLVAIAVQKELQNQKRSGGILSPYGVA